MTTPTPTVYHSRSRTTRRRLLVFAAVLVLVLVGFLIGRLAVGESAAGSVAASAPSSAGPPAPSSSPSPVPSPTPSTPAIPVGVDAYQPIQAESAVAQSGVQFQDTEDEGGGKNAGWISNGDWLRFDQVNFGDTPATELIARVASEVGDGVDGRMDIRLDDQNNAPIGSLPVHGTGGWQNWINQATDTTGTTGVHTVFLTFAADRGDDFINLNYLTFAH
jgi:hypothetical protein